MKATFFSHFAGGEDGNEIKPLVEQLRKGGITGMVIYNAEDDISGNQTSSSKKILDTSSGIRYYHESEKKCDIFLKNTIDCIDTAAEVSGDRAITAIKITAFMQPNVLQKLSNLTLELKKQKEDSKSDTIFNFLDGDYEKIGLNEWKEIVCKNSNFGKIFSIIKNDNQLNDNELGQFFNVLKRLDRIAKRASERNVQMFVDAEQTYFQWAITEICIELMRKYNRNKLIVLNTYQNYLKSTHETLKNHLEQSKHEGFNFGCKLVRGAYMEQERARAKEYGYEDPIQPTFDDTSRNYEKNLLMCLKEIKLRDKKSLKIVAASHNEDTVRFGVKKMDELNIDRSDNQVYFGQLYGMCDFISHSLGASGYGIIKAIPYGPLVEVIPYLTRRANENRGIFDKVKKEKRLLRTELFRRLKKGQLIYRAV